MIELGTVENTMTVGGKIIVAIRLGSDEPSLRIGQTVTFSVSGSYALSGFKIWPGQGLADLLFESLTAVPKADEAALVE